MSFLQDPPRLGNQWREDRALRRLLTRRLPAEVLASIEPSLDAMGELAAGELLALSHESRSVLPEWIPFDAWGRHVDEIRVNAAWRRCREVAAQAGLIATGYERAHGAHSRLHQFALVYLFAPSSQVYTCPLAMSDGAARSLETLASPELRDSVLPRLIERDPARVWTSGQWMTERTGGSDVGLSETVAKLGPDGWRLHGIKWFTSAVTSEVALTLARPEGNGPGGKGLALFLVHTRDAQGRPNRVRVLRLKDKLGTRSVPTAELELDGMPATLVSRASDGVRDMASMLNLTRTWNAVCSAASLRRGLALARDYARRRVAFGAPLSEKPLHLETLAALAAEQEAALQLTFHAVAMLGREEAGELDEAGLAVLRLLQPVAKLLTARQAVAGASEVLEAFGGAGYVEDTGLPEILRDAQVLSIWEGTTNVLSLEAFRAVARAGALAPFTAEVKARAGAARAAVLREPAQRAREAVDHAAQWWAAGSARGAAASEAGARKFAFTLGRALALALLVEQAQWDLDRDGDARTAEAARRFAQTGVDLLQGEPGDAAATARLALDEPLPG
ncbi:MAG TPA: acyl-CoA dehydrogenase family protein [Myxococcota bacterium]|jgi:alkylation response protein AidB-like acyl-CoA dehydrogenase